MKKKDIITVVISLAVIIGSIVFLLGGFGGGKKTEDVVQVEEKVDFTGNIDTGAIDKLKERKDYGKATTDNIGREDPFANF